MEQRRIGNRTVGAIGLGAMPMSVREGQDEAQSIRTVEAALEAGVTLIDTADAYAPHEDSFGHNERLIGKALEQLGARDQVLVATKGGHTRRGDAWAIDGSPAYLRGACLASLERLGVEQIGLFQHHRPDRYVPYEETMAGLKSLHDEGLVEMVGISNADPDQIRTARGILGDALVAVQNEFSPAFRSSLPEVQLCAELGLAFLAWSPLGGISKAAALGQEWDEFAAVAHRHDVSPQQVCLAWELSLSPTMIPIPGASRPESISDSARANELQLDEDDLARLHRTS